ncbi:MAG: patatin-like phospholipase family protein [Acidobacteria bacterium]|nr:patatin-like phospholipase family protein [Acidobacteriota bacterium]MYH22161.1 patatin-like phospholipase family protein [Acidobacteriota bacterium]MYK80660.1 patatin-like phospholipase family protein [Acidobacteriota bacterium]
MLSVDGGGMRGYYSAVYLAACARHYAKTRGEDTLDIGAGFDLITGTSTGAILACALAKGVDLDRIACMYRRCGREIFRKRLPQSFWRLLAFLPGHPRRLEEGAGTLEKGLVEEFKRTTLLDIWKDRGIALAIPTVHLSDHRARVFKTPHLANSRHRDDDYTLVDICLASTAAPIYRSMARVQVPGSDQDEIFLDGGLWANSPVLVGLIDALEMTTVGDRIEVYSLGTSAPPKGEPTERDNVNRGVFKWRFGGGVINISLDAQQFASHHMARMLSRHLRRECTVIRFPHAEIPSGSAAHFDLDATDETSLRAMEAQAQSDVNETLSRSGDASDSPGRLVHQLFQDLPMRSSTPRPGTN